MSTASAILALLAGAPALITEITALYKVVRSDLSTDDQDAIDAALEAAITSDAAATASADRALDAASKV